VNLTFRQYVLLLTAITLFYDEVSKTAPSEMKHEIMQLADIIQEYADRKKRADERRENLS
jgi:hypothetical protein